MKPQLKKIETGISTAMPRNLPAFTADDVQVLVYEEDGEVVVGVDVLKPCDKSVRRIIANVVKENGCRDVEAIEENVLPRNQGFRLYAKADIKD